MTRVLTIGTFDPLHTGHLGLFTQCRRIGGPDTHLIVGVNGDEFIRENRGTPPLLPYTVRADVIRGLRLVDEVVENPTIPGQAALICHLRPDLLIVGQDWAVKDYVKQLDVPPDWFTRQGIQLCFVPRTGGWSSTALKADGGLDDWHSG